MKLKLEITPDLAALMQAEIAAGEKAVTTAMREAGAGLKSAWRSQIAGAGLGTRLGNSIRLVTYPKGSESLNAAELVWSNAPVIVGAHDAGPLIRSKDGFWLAIPTVAVGKSTRGGRITPGEWERRTGLRLRFIYRRRGPSLLVADLRRRGDAERRRHPHQQLHRDAERGADRKPGGHGAASPAGAEEINDPHRVRALGRRHPNLPHDPPPFCRRDLAIQRLDAPVDLGDRAILHRLAVITHPRHARGALRRERLAACAELTRQRH